MGKSKSKKLLILRGLPASGKSTYAKSWVEHGHLSRTMVERDQIRKNGSLFKDGVYNHKRGDEGIVIREQKRLIEEAFAEGKSVVVSDTNLSYKTISRLMNIAEANDATVRFKDFLDVPLDVLIERDSKRENSVGESVIRRMFHQSVKKLPTFVEWDDSLPVCVISDIDGTLTMGPKDRSPYDWEKVGNDDLNLAVSHILDGVKTINYAELFLFSGRDGSSQLETEKWLNRQCITYDKLFMRAPGDRRPDSVVKREMFEQHIRGKYNVLFILDDRPKVCRMWRDELGLNVLQAGDPHYEF